MPAIEVAESRLLMRCPRNQFPELYGDRQAGRFDIEASYA